MAVPVARVHLAMAHAALPGLLPTPSSAVVFTLPTNYQSPWPKPTGRADAADRWDARKQQPLKNEPSSASSSSSSSSKAGRADRWDARRKMGNAQSPCGQRSADDRRRASSCEERWDVNKKRATSPSSSSSSSSRVSGPASGAASTACARPLLGRRPSSSAERRDAHRKQKPRPPPLPTDDDDGESSTGSNDVEVDDYDDDTPRAPQPTAPRARPGFFLASPPPRMLPIPSLLVLPRLVAA